jgi:paraquat-inducible protein B
LSVLKPDKKASFIEVKVTTRDELFSKYFSERLVKIATDHYLDSKIKTKALNIAKLQSKADSLAALLNNKTYLAASSQQSLVDANPALRTVPIASEISSREKAMAATIFAEVVKNLEVSKTILSQETPVIQIVDQSTFPLPREKVSKIKSLILGGILACFILIFYLLAQKWLRTQL